MLKRIWKYLALVSLLLGVGMGLWYFFSNTQVLNQEAQETGLPQWTQNVALVVVGDEEVTSTDVDFEVKLLMSSQNDPDEAESDGEEKQIPSSNHIDDAVKHEVLAALIERKMLFQYISHDRNFDKNDAARYVSCIAEWQESIKEMGSLLKDNRDRERLKKILCEGSVVRQYVDEQIFPKVVISDEEVKKYYKENASELAKPERVTIRQILINEEKLAKQIRYQLRPNNFSEIARKNSQGPEAVNGGLLGPFKKGDYPEIFDQAFNMRVGDISDVLKSPYGFHIFYLMSKEKKQELSFDQAKEEVHNILKREKQEKSYADLVDLATKLVSIVPAQQTL